MLKDLGQDWATALLRISSCIGTYNIPHKNRDIRVQLLKLPPTQGFGIFFLKMENLGLPVWNSARNDFKQLISSLGADFSK
ncbi:hypothetical protein Y032_0001g109 [Ancylostoma ceylanicum]|nr:hypothetical protein Y032_0001g109 [Ancylostoma ceylanicum]